jgi:hypothetical protein
VYWATARDLIRSLSARRVLKRQFGVNGQHDPILSQQYDAALRKEPYDEYEIKSHRVYQRPAVAVFMQSIGDHRFKRPPDDRRYGLELVIPCYRYVVVDRACDCVRFMESECVFCLSLIVNQLH